MAKFTFSESPALKRTDPKSNPFKFLLEYNSPSKQSKSLERSVTSRSLSPHQARPKTPHKARPKTPHENNNPLGRLSRLGYITPEWYETQNGSGKYTQRNKLAPKKKHTSKVKPKASSNKANMKK